MSFQSMTWATSQTCGSAAAKLVLLMLANHTNGHTGKCNPRHKLLAAECDMTVETLKSHLKKLEALGFITIIPQYAEGVQLPNQYMLNMDGGGGKFSPEGGGKFSPEGGGKFSTTYNQEVKPVIEPTESTPIGFDSFWSAYPRKVAKPAALKAWRKAKPTDRQIDAIVDDVRKRQNSDEWQKSDGQFIPHPATYLNQRRWEDSAVETPTGIFAGAI
jgi:hypothetical protein